MIVGVRLRMYMYASGKIYHKDRLIKPNEM